MTQVDTLCLTVSFKPGCQLLSSLLHMTIDVTWAQLALVSYILTVSQVVEISDLHYILQYHSPVCARWGIHLAYDNSRLTQTVKIFVILSFHHFSLLSLFICVKLTRVGLCVSLSMHIKMPVTQLAGPLY